MRVSHRAPMERSAVRFVAAINILLLRSKADMSKPVLGSSDLRLQVAKNKGQTPRS